jgi:hypothetical protein
MDWIERWFGMSPDDGDGSLEGLIFVALVVIGVWLLVSRSDTLRGRVRSVFGEARELLARFSGRHR